MYKTKEAQLLNDIFKIMEEERRLDGDETKLMQEALRSIDTKCRWAIAGNIDHDKALQQIQDIIQKVLSAC